MRMRNMLIFLNFEHALMDDLLDCTVINKKEGIYSVRINAFLTVADRSKCTGLALNKQDMLQ